MHPKSCVTDTTGKDLAWWLSISAVSNAKHDFVLDDCAKVEFKKEKQLSTQIVCALIYAENRNSRRLSEGTNRQHVLAVLQKYKIKTLIIKSSQNIKLGREYY